ncbi:DUF5979 domain-containing protein [Isoptericola sp. NPDC055063]
MTVTNDVTSSTAGAVTITKEVTGDDGGTADEFTVDRVCTTPDEVTTGSVTLAAGETSDPIGDLPVGTGCTVTERPGRRPGGHVELRHHPDAITIGQRRPGPGRGRRGGLPRTGRHRRRRRRRAVRPRPQRRTPRPPRRTGAATGRRPGRAARPRRPSRPG